MISRYVHVLLIFMYKYVLNTLLINKNNIKTTSINSDAQKKPPKKPRNNLKSAETTYPVLNHYTFYLQTKELILIQYII